MLEAYFLLSGRMRRLPYFGYSLLLIPIVGILVGLGAAFADNARSPFVAVLLVIGLAALFVAWAGTALGVKRCHDLDRSGWFYFWLVLLPGAVSTTLSLDIHGSHVELGVPVIGGIAGLISALGGLYLLLARGTDGPNRFGYPP
jgi:uncharacterized membrane protein YhaH (DUF805 family)